MRIYQFHFYNPSGGVPALDFSDCADDGSATQEAFAQLRRHGSCQGVDVYEEDRLVIRLSGRRTRFSRRDRPFTGPPERPLLG